MNGRLALTKNTYKKSRITEIKKTKHTHKKGKNCTSVSTRNSGFALLSQRRAKKHSTTTIRTHLWGRLQVLAIKSKWWNDSSGLASVVWAVRKEGGKREEGGLQHWRFFRSSSQWIEWEGTAAVLLKEWTRRGAFSSLLGRDSTFTSTARSPRRTVQSDTHTHTQTHARHSLRL